MTFLVSVALVIIAVALVAVGAITGSSQLFVAAAGASALAVILLWRKITASCEDTFVTDGPPAVQPDWDRPLGRRRGDAAGSAGVAGDLQLTDVGILDYDDLVAAEVLPTLETLSVEQLRTVIARERAGMNRQAIVHRAEVLIELTLGPAVNVTESEHAHSMPERQTPERTLDARRPDRKGPDLSI